MNLNELIESYLRSFRMFKKSKHNKQYWKNAMEYWKRRIDENIKGGL